MTNVFQKEQVTLSADTWTFDETILSPIPDADFGAMSIPKDVSDAFGNMGYWVSAQSIPTWSTEAGKEFVRTGTELIFTMGPWARSTSATLRHGEKVIIGGLGNIYKLEDQWK